VNWFRAVATDTDALANAIAGGESGETVSLHVAKEAAKGRAWAVTSEQIIDLAVGANHCEDTLAGKPTPAWQAWRSAAAVAVPFLALVAGMVWLIRAL
jgi:hypothetical protein